MNHMDCNIELVATERGPTKPKTSHKGKGGPDDKFIYVYDQEKRLQTVGLKKKRYGNKSPPDRTLTPGSEQGLKSRFDDKRKASIKMPKIRGGEQQIWSEKSVENDSLKNKLFSRDRQNEVYPPPQSDRRKLFTHHGRVFLAHDLKLEGRNVPGQDVDSLVSNHEKYRSMYRSKQGSNPRESSRDHPPSSMNWAQQSSIQTNRAHKT